MFMFIVCCCSVVPYRIHSALKEMTLCVTPLRVRPQAVGVVQIK